MQDVAQHTRIQPNQREMIFKKFVDKVYKTPKVCMWCVGVCASMCVCVCVQARDELESWGFQLDPRMIQMNGRVLDREKILFGRNKSIVANEEADWGREAVKEHVITPVRPIIIIAIVR